MYIIVQWTVMYSFLRKNLKSLQIIYIFYNPLYVFVGADALMLDSEDEEPQAMQADSINSYNKKEWCQN